jgi:Fe-S oxidoreductase
MIDALPTLAEPQHFSLIEKLLFAALVIASAAAFWRRFGPILKKILESKKDPSFHLAPIGKRIWDFVSEVLFQSKVIRERPLPGIAHALVFWAFLAFALVTLNHCAVAFGIGFLAPDGLIGRFYFYIAALFALACAAGILSLFIRRFLIRPKWLGEKLSWESGVIAGLIFLLMATYLASFTVADSSPTARILWWIHTLTLLVFLPLIPHTKHLHLILSPATIFLSRGSFAQIPPLAGDEDFGLVAGADLTQLVSLQVYSCVECGRCTEHCPAANTGKLLNPKEIILGVRAYLNDLGPASDQPLLGQTTQGNYNSQEAVFQCTTCGACEFQCPVGIEHVPIITGLRRGAVNTGAWEDSHGSKLFLALERGSNALGMPTSDRDKFIEKQAFPIFDGTQEFCLWLGCMGGYDPKGREIISDFARVMNYLGTSYGVLRKEKCTGDPVRRLGNDLLFQQLTEDNLKALAENKVKKIVAICPHCVRTIQEDWKEYGTPPEIEHHSEFLARFANKLPGAVGLPRAVGPGFIPDNKPSEGAGGFNPLNSPEEKQRALAPERIVYHDPCYLGRYRNIYDPPRAIVSQAGTLVEAPRNRERSFCCGAGGGLAFLGEETGERVSHNRVQELVATGAQTIAAACPFCNTMFRDALASTGEAAPQLLDIAQLVARSLPDPSQLAAELPIDSAGPRLQRPQGSRCSYSGSITITSLTPDILQTIQKAADDRALTLDIGNNYIELEFEGRDSNQFVVDFLRILAKAVGTASGEFRCEITADRQDPLYEFFTIRDSKLFRQRGLIIRESEEDITDKTSLTRQSETS